MSKAIAVAKPSIESVGAESHQPSPHATKSRKQKLIDAPRQSNTSVKALANEAVTVNDHPTRPPRLILIVAPVSSRLSRDKWEAQRASRSAPQRAVTEFVTVEEPRKEATDIAGHGQPQRGTSNHVAPEKSHNNDTDTARHTTTDYDIYEHPYVKRLEERCDKLEAKYDAQVRRTEE